MANDCRVGLAGYFYSNDVRYVNTIFVTIINI